MGSLLSHFAFQLAVVAAGAGVVALQRHMEPAAWQVVAAAYVLMVLASVGVIIRRNRRAAADAAPGGGDDASVLAQFRSMPVGLRVVHTPAVVHGPQLSPSGGDDRMYRWLFRTEVHALDRPVTITHFGALAWDGRDFALPDDGVADAGLLSPEQFEAWYDCPGGVVQPGTPAVDASNWAGSERPVNFQQLWVFVGVDSTGAACKGEAVVTLRSTVPSSA